MTTDIKEVTDYLYKIPRFARTGGLSMTAERLKLLGNPQDTFKYIHVAGTNGKGSVCAFMEQCLRKAGFKTGLFTSPHLVKINERIQIDRENVGDETFCRAFERVKALVDDQAAQGIAHPTFFEFIYLMAMVIFAEAGIEYGVIETGLGGRMDLTNVIQAPELTIITSIGRDHTAILGDTIGQIAGEKAGIIKSGIPVIYLDDKPEAARVIKRRADEVGAPAFPVEKEWIEDAQIRDGQIRFAFRCPYGQKYDIILNTSGIYQIENCSIALSAMEILRAREPELYALPAEAFRQMLTQAVEETRWAGRMERIRENIYVDGAHNDDGVRKLTESLRTAFKDRQIILVFAVAEDKDYQQMAAHLCTLPNLRRIIVTELDNGRRRDHREVMEDFSRKWHGNISGTYNVNKAIETAIHMMEPEDVLICTGSLYLVGHVKEMLGGI